MLALWHAFLSGVLMLLFCADAFCFAFSTLTMLLILVLIICLIIVNPCGHHSLMHGLEEEHWPFFKSLTGS
jgi:multisubunit Na+/H+ antiporter MnhG subunit